MVSGSDIIWHQTECVRTLLKASVDTKETGKSYMEIDRDVGFTGTQQGCAERQLAALVGLLRQLQKRGVVRLRHGACIGADEQAHAVARRIGLGVFKHPPSDTSKMAECPMLPGEETAEPDEYLKRNRAIVDGAPILVATPKEEEGEALRSGTWATVRYARKKGRVVYIVRPSGKIERETHNISY